jgi:ribonuclease BN (tRNA processing enzyme)
MDHHDQRGLLLNRRALLKNAVMLAGFGAGASLFGFGGMEEVLAQAGRGNRGAAASAPGSSLILLGTQGGPSVNLTRGEAANAILVDGRVYLIDCGYGTVRALTQAGIRLADVGNVFLTHLHDDHTVDLAALLSLKWTGGSTAPRPTAVYGPFGSRAMVEAAIAFFKANSEIRIVDEGRTVRPETIYSGHDLSAPTVTEVFKDESVTVKAAENTHFPDRAKEKMPYRSFAYRFNMADRSIVFSGDTAYSAGLVELARGADVFVCEAVDMSMRQQQVARGGAAANTESIARHVIETHSSTEDVGRMASEAKVKTVVLSHLLPGSNGRGVADDSYIASVRKFFAGEVIVGHDQLRL